MSSRQTDPENPLAALGLFGRLGHALAGLMILPVAWLPARVHLWLGGILGRLAFRLLKRRRVIAVANIERCQEAGFLPASLDAVSTARESFVGVARTILESLAFYRRGMGYFKGRYGFVGEDRLQEALKGLKKGGPGLILLTAHIGCWELAPQAIRERFGIRIVIVGRSQGGPLTNALIAESRTKTGNGYIFKANTARVMLQTLRDGGIIGTLFDQAAIVESEGALLPFMGRPAHTNLGPERLAAKTGSTLLPVFAIRDGARHSIEFGEPIPAPPGAGRDWAANAALTLNDTLGERILKDPGQWMWGHRRWKTPEGIKEDPLSY
ncbi:MAG: hypothetical protein LBF40_07360 [Deltaproteobacteria bacterium]|nr:hypothetical protein [Deltaproteobacteria bacterium]